MYSGLRKIAIYNPLTGATVQMNNVSADGKFTNTPMTIETSAGELLYCANDMKFEFKCYDDDVAIYNTLKAWTLAETKIHMVAYGVSDHILWQADSFVTVAMDYIFKVGDRNGYNVSIAYKGLEDNINVGNNILFLNSGLIPTGSAGKWTFESFVSTFNTTSSLYRFDSTIEPAYVSTEIVFPIAGADFVFSPAHTTSTSTGSIKSTTLVKNFAGADLISTEGAFEANTTFTTPANTYKLVLQTLYTTDTNSGCNTSYPYLGLAKESLLYKDILY